MNQSTRIEAIYRYPVKGLSAERLPSTLALAVRASTPCGVGVSARAPFGRLATTRRDATVATRTLHFMMDCSTSSR